MKRDQFIKQMAFGAAALYIGPRIRINGSGNPVKINGAGSSVKMLSTLPTQCVFEGDSMTAVNAWMTTADSYPYKLQQKLNPGSWYGFNNVANGGDTVTQMISQGPSQVDAIKSAAYKKWFASCWGGINDLYNGGSGGTTAATVQSRLTTWHNDRQAAGWETIAFTITATQNPAYPSLHAGIETQREALNTWIQANWSTTLGAALLIDLAADSRIGDYNSVLDTTYFRADQIHMTPTGAQVVADLIYEQLKTIHQ